MRAAAYKEFEDISERSGMLGAMDTLYQRGKIQEESLYYEQKKQDGSLPPVGVNTFLGNGHGGEITITFELIRRTEEQKGQQIANVRGYQRNRNDAVLPSPRGRGAGGEGSDSPDLAYLQSTARKRENLVAARIEAVKTHSLGQISHVLYEVGGQYRRNM